MRQMLSTLSLALGNIRANLFHTVLSVLGIIIGVGALVTILCMIDGMEKFAKEQIHTTISLNTIALQSEPNYVSNDISIRKKEFAFLTEIIFGTYPAMRASRLDPVEAIRRE